MKKLLHGGSHHGETVSDTGVDSDLLKIHGIGGRKEVYEKTKYFAERHEGFGEEFATNRMPELVRYTVYIYKHEENTTTLDAPVTC